MQYHTTPHTTTGVSTAKLLNKRKLTSRLSRIHPNLQVCMYEKQENVKERHYQNERPIDFSVGDLAWALFDGWNRWLPEVKEKD